MKTRVAAFVAVCLLPLAACTSPVPSPTSTPSTTAPSGGAATTTTSPGTSPTPSASPTSGGKPSALPAVVVLSGTAIGNLPLGKAPATVVDPLVVARLGKAKVGPPELCRSATDRAALATVEHSWPGFAVRYGSSGSAAVAIGWTVDLTDVPDGFELDARLPWRPTFSALKHLDGVEFSTESGVQYAELPRERITWAGPVAAARPDTLEGGTRLTCG